MILNQTNFVNFLFSFEGFVIVSIFIFLIGLSIGSFLNVVIYRLPNNTSIVFPSSACPTCGKKIKFYDNIPVLSYIILKGKCRSCGNKISIIYPAIEILTGLLLYALFLKFFYKSFFYYSINAYDVNYFKEYLGFIFDRWIISAFFLFILIPIAFIDLFHSIIPDSLNILLIISGFILNIFLLHTSFLFPLYGFLAGGLFFFLIAFFYEFIKKREGLGGGDIKLIAGIGAFLGLKGVIFTIFIGAVLALLGFLALFIILKFKRGQQQKESLHESISNFKVPFGPFLSLASVFFIFYGNELFRMYLNLLLH
ncbi:MAG: prepilin peptidase [bacterium]